MKQDKSDYYLLNVWAGPSVKSPTDGYASLQHLKARAGEKRTLKSIKREVHKALERNGYNPHTGPTLIQVWLDLHRKFGNENLN